MRKGVPLNKTDIPFLPARLFSVYDISSYEVRGEHAHYECRQFLIALHGAVSVVVDDGINAKETRLDTPGVGLYLPPMTWSIQYKFTDDAVLFVMASHPYSADDYIRDYDLFLKLKKENE